MFTHHYTAPRDFLHRKLKKQPDWARSSSRLFVPPNHREPLHGNPIPHAQAAVGWALPCHTRTSRCLWGPMPRSSVMWKPGSIPETCQLIKIYQWPKVSDLKLREGKENISTLNHPFPQTPLRERTKFKMYFTADFWIADTKLVLFPTQSIWLPQRND